MPLSSLMSSLSMSSLSVSSPTPSFLDLPHDMWSEVLLRVRDARTLAAGGSLCVLFEPPLFPPRASESLVSTRGVAREWKGEREEEAGVVVCPRRANRF